MVALVRTSLGTILRNDLLNVKCITMVLRRRGCAAGDIGSHIVGFCYLSEMELGVCAAKNLAAKQIDLLVKVVTDNDAPCDIVGPLKIARNLVRPDNSAPESARAYLYLQQLEANEVMIAWRTTIEAKFMCAARSVREAMLLQICAPIACLDDDGFDRIIRDVFRDFVDNADHLDSTLMQMHLARGAMVRLAEQRSVFESAVPEVLSFKGERCEVVADTLSMLWPAYQAAVEGDASRLRNRRELWPTAAA